MKPNLTEDEVARIARYAVDYVGDDRPAYGRPIEEAFEDLGWSWLEALVLAGHLPNCEGIELAIRATRESWLRRIREAEEQDVIGDALGWASHGLWFRETGALLESFALELQRTAIRLLHTPEPEATNADAANDVPSGASAESSWFEAWAGNAEVLQDHEDEIGEHFDLAERLFASKLEAFLTGQYLERARSLPVHRQDAQ